jgi:hypothetical protein
MATDFKHTSNQTASSHTPGPWVADSHGHILAHGGTTNVASTWTTPDGNYPEGRPYKANARLLAAAPALLEALERIVEILPSGSQPWEANSQEILAREAALAAIADAKGLAV